ncbi:MAG TPA: helix-turn-helix domain-containing protein [Herpetosiphonaceae bacterium]
MTQQQLTATELRSLISHSPLTMLERHTEQLADRVAALLSTDIVVLDMANQIVASNKRALIGRLFNPGLPAHPSNDYWVPLSIEGRVVKVVASQPANGEVLSSRLLKKLVDMVYGQIRADWHPSPQEIKDTFIRQLLHGELADLDGLHQRASHVGLDLGQPYHVILIDASAAVFASGASVSALPNEEQIRRRVQGILPHIANLAGPASQVVASYLGNGEIAALRPAAGALVGARRAPAPKPGLPAWFDEGTLLLADRIYRRLSEQLDPLVRVGVGRCYPGALGMSRSFFEARSVIELGRRLGREGAIDTLDRLGIAAFVGVADERIKADVAERWLAPLRADPELYKTVSVFFAENCCPSTTSQRLAIHRNTLSYRLDKIADLTGLNPRNFDEAVQLRLALYTCDLYGQH